MLEFELILQEEYPVLQIMDKRNGKKFNCNDETDMRILIGVINDEITYLTDCGADSERLINKLYKDIQKYKNGAAVY